MVLYQGTFSSRRNTSARATGIVLRTALLGMTSVLAMAQAQAEPATAPASSAAPSAQAASVEKIVVTGKKDAVPKPVLEKRPTTTETKGIDEIEKTVNVINTEDALRYFPSTFARKRHIGDTQAPITTRTSGVGASARSLIYADGVLLSALIANNNSIGSPKWGMVSPEEIARIDVMYGPFSAAFAGNSIGSVVEITTRMPDGFEGSLNAVGSLQDFRQYATKDTYGAHQFSGTIGDRFGDVAFWLGASATDSDSQPLTYVTANRPASPSLAGTVLTGAFNTQNRTGAPIVVTGAGGFEHQKQDNVKLKVSWDVTPETTIAYSLGRFGNDTESTVESYLRNGVGTTIYSGGPFNINGYAYPSIAASAFSNNVYTYNETQWMHALVVNHEGKGNLDWRIAASLYDYDESVQRIPSTALPIAFSGGPGSITRLDGTGWSNIDLKGIFRPEGVSGDHEISFGYHFDRYDLENHRYNTSDWRVGTEGALASAAEGKTRTSALWLQDAWHLGPQLLLTAGLRAENWKAYDGVNYSLSPALNVRQPELNASKVSPKASLQVDIAPGWVAQASFGHAYRFPTVSELYQSVTTGVTLTVPNPNLRPEDDVSTEVSVRHEFQKGNVRLSVFTEDIRDALISQTAPLVPASPTLFNYVQNIDKVRSSGVEVVATRNDLFFEGLSVTGSMTFVDSQIVADAAFPAAVNKRTPQVPQWRSTVVATYQPDDKWTFTLAGRYSDRVYATIDNSDPVTHTYQGFDSFLVFDARVNYDIDDHWRAAAGVENLGKDDYILFHSFPQRTATAELQYRF